MKKFNQVITVEVSVDSIANLLLQSFAADFKHADIVAEAVIATAMEKDTLGYIYNALNGYPAIIDFKVNEDIVCEAYKYSYVLDQNDQREQKRVKIGAARVLEINEYSHAKLKVEYETTTKDGKGKTETSWVSHKECSKIQLP